MEHQSPKIGILFFSHSATVEADAKDFSGNHRHDQDRQVARQLITHTLKEITKTNLPYFVADENHQHGHSFGERFSNAFAKMFGRGYDYVIAVGNDTPQLSGKHLTNAAEKLRAGFDVVLGPSTDGGTWLTAYSKEAFDKKVFKRCPWQTNQLLSALRKNSSAFTIYELPELSDIDSARTLSNFITNAPRNLRSLATRLQSILSTVFGDTSSSSMEKLVNEFYKTTSLRAPPQV